MSQPSSRPEARSRLGLHTANELGAPVASSIPEQLPGHEPASARKGYEDGNGLVLRNRCIERSSRRDGVARTAMLAVHNDAGGWPELVERLRGLAFTAIALAAPG